MIHVVLEIKNHPLNLQYLIEAPFPNLPTMILLQTFRVSDRKQLIDLLIDFGSQIVDYDQIHLTKPTNILDSSILTLMKSNPKDLVPQFFEKTASTYEKIVNQTTFGKDKYWKKEILDKIPQSKTILDLACGTGILTRQISEEFPDAKIIGVDITQNYLDVAKNKSKKYKNIKFIYQDAEKLDLKIKFDCITSSYIPKYCEPEKLIQKCINHLNPGGKIILHDFMYPKNKLIRIFWNLYFIVLNFIGFFIPNWQDVFKELPKLIRSSQWLNEYE